MSGAWEDVADQFPLLSPFADMITVSPFQTVSVRFSAGLRAGEITKAATVTGDGAVAAANSVASASSAATGTAALVSRQFVRYENGRPWYWKMTAAFSGTGLATVGAAYTGQNGFLLMYEGGTLSLAYLRGGVITSRTGISGTVLEQIGVDLSKMNIWYMLGAYLGVANPVLLVKKGGRLHKVATIDLEGVLTGVHMLDPVFNLGIYAANGASVSTGSWDGGVLLGASESPGQMATPKFFPHAAVATTGAISGSVTVNSNTRVVAAVFKNSSTTGESELKNFQFMVTPPTSGAGVVYFQFVYLDNPAAQLSGTPNYTVDLGNMEVCHTAGTGAQTSAPALITYVSGGTFLLPVVVDYSKGTPAAIATNLAKDFGLKALPGDVFALVITNNGNANVTAYFPMGWADL